mgnify:FL=1
MKNVTKMLQKTFFTKKCVSIDKINFINIIAKRTKNIDLK